MKKNLSIITLLGILYLMGCSEEEPQSVAFLGKQFSVTSEGDSLSVSIEANCPWTISNSHESLSVHPSSGNGSTAIHINVEANTNHVERNFSISIWSDDKTSADELTITQEPYYEVKANSPNVISCEGGELIIPILSNDNIGKTEAPEWITFVESKSLKSYTYKFEAEPNMTGSVRQGAIKLIGLKSEAEVKVTQDSYAPDSVLAVLPAMVELAEFPLVVPVSIKPEYADLSKLEIRASGCGTATFKDGNLILDAEKDGLLSIYFIGEKGHLIREHKITVVKSFDCEHIGVNIPDTLLLSKDPYAFPVELFPKYAKIDLISIKSEGIESSFDGKNILLTTTKEGESVIKIYSSGNEIYSKGIIVYDNSYPTHVDIEAPEAICKGRHSYKINVYPEGADISKLKLISGHGSEASIIRDSLIINILTDQFTPFVYFYSRNALIETKKFTLISESASFNINNGDIFVVGETIEIIPEIPMEYANIYTSDQSVLEKINDGIFKVKKEGVCSIILTNNISKKQKSVFIHNKKIHMYAKLIEAGLNLFDTYRIFEVYLKGFNLGPGELIFESGNNRIPVAKIEQTTHYSNYKKFTVKDGYGILSDKDIYKKYKLTYMGNIENEYNIYVEEGDI